MWEAGVLIVRVSGGRAGVGKGGKGERGSKDTTQSMREVGVRPSPHRPPSPPRTRGGGRPRGADGGEGAGAKILPKPCGMEEGHRSGTVRFGCDAIGSVRSGAVVA